MPQCADKSSPHWRLADHDAGSDVGVTFEKAYPADDYDHEPDTHVFTVHVWWNGTDACQEFAKELCDLMNKHGIKPPKGWEP